MRLFPGLGLGTSFIRATDGILFQPEDESTCDGETEDWLIVMDNHVGVKSWVLRLFSGSWAAVFCLTALAFRHQWPTSLGWLAPLALAIACSAGFLVPEWMRWPYRLVERVLAPVGKFFSLLMLAAVFYGIFTPFALALSLFRWDPLRLRGLRQSGTGWSMHQPKPGRPDYRWQY